MLLNKLPWEVSRTFLLPNTAKFLAYQSEILRGHLKRADTNSMIENLQKQLQQISTYLGKHVYYPKDQTEIAHLGSKVKVRIDGVARYVVLDTLVFGKNPFVANINMPLGHIIFGKKVGDEGLYVVKNPMNNKDAFHKYEILGLESFTDAKALIKTFSGNMRLVTA